MALSIATMERTSSPVGVPRLVRSVLVALIMLAVSISVTISREVM